MLNSMLLTACAYPVMSDNLQGVKAYVSISRKENLLDMLLAAATGGTGLS
jgi:hypothetical protein